MIGLQGKKINIDKLPPNNLVFLLDVSGSMSSPNKLPLLKSAFKLLTKQLRSEDRVSIVVYAGAAGLVLDSTSGNQKEKILSAIEKLNAGGSTAGGAGIIAADACERVKVEVPQIYLTIQPMIQPTATRERLEAIPTLIIPANPSGKSKMRRRLLSGICIFPHCHD